jgi:hypothetical protein
LLYYALIHIASKIVMIPNLTSIIAILILGTTTLILIMLLPALLELKKPKDGGPRMILDNISEVQIQIMRMIPIASIEDEQKFDSALIQPLAKIIAILPSLEV